MKGIGDAPAPCRSLLTAAPPRCVTEMPVVRWGRLSRVAHSLRRDSLQGALPIPVPSSSALPEHR